MPRFNFEALSPPDFEELVRDLLQADWNVTIEAFKEGRDGGIDLRYAGANDGKIIVQCKRYGKSGFSKLLSHLRDKEKHKIERLNPQRYVVATILGLTPNNKDKIVNLLSPYVLSTSDVIGAGDLESLLSRFPQIARANFKLWLTSTEVLEHVLHNAEICQTEFEVARVNRKLPLFVQNDSFPRARDLLDQNRIAIISGPPGIGKTTLAEMVLYAHLEEGFEPVVIKGDIVEAKKLFNARKKQIFYFDDFLGQIFLGDRSEFLGKNEDTVLLDFMEMVRVSEWSRFVLTTREHILSGALQTSERFSHSPVLDHKCVLTLQDYKLGHRARILFNHLYFSDLSESHKEAILHERFFLDVIKHKHFNPRLIEWLSSESRVRNIAPDNYRAHITQLLESPESIWSHAFNSQISSAARHLLFSLYSLGEDTDVANLETVFIEFHRLSSAKYNLKATPSDYRRALQELDSSFLIYSKGLVKFLNPSIREFVASVISNEREVVLDLLNSAVRFRQVANIWSLLSARSTDVAALILNSDAECFYTAFRKLLNGPSLRWQKNSAGQLVGKYIDIDVEGRLVFLMKLAELQKAPKPAELAIHAADSLVASWERHSFSYYFVLQALDELSNCTWLLAQGGRVAYRKILDGVISHLSVANANDWVKLVGLSKKALDWNLSDEARLNEALKEYQERGVHDQRRECDGIDELRELKESLETLTENKVQGFSRVIQILEQEIIDKEFEREELREEEGYSPNMSASVATEMTDQDVQQMFATLVEH